MSFSPNEAPSTGAVAIRIVVVFGGRRGGGL